MRREPDDEEDGGDDDDGDVWSPDLAATNAPKTIANTVAFTGAENVFL